MGLSFESKLLVGNYLVFFLLNAAVIIVIKAGSVYFGVFRDFENFVREFERDRFEAVTGILEDEYTNSQSWETNSLHIELLN